VLNSYDDSILYTDHVIGEVIRTLASTKAISAMWYVSDHGEDFASPACKLAGHGNGTVNDLRIPSVLWYSDAYASAKEAELAQARVHSTMKLTTENVFESLIDMAGLDFPTHDRTRSVFSTQWHERPRIVTGFAQSDIDFDDARISDKCRIMLAHDE
jgi:glucan phosphoethanolaminetransferase (alkaline phosphatase superfamily)